MRSSRNLRIILRYVSFASSYLCQSLGKQQFGFEMPFKRYVTRRGFRLLSPIIRLAAGSLEVSESNRQKTFATWYDIQFSRRVQIVCAVTEEDWLRGMASWGQTMIELNIQLREIDQRETTLLQQEEALLKQEDISPDDQKRQIERREELQSLNQDFWKIERRIYMNDLQLLGGPLERAYKSVRKEPEWGFWGFLADDCAQRGGCCSRDCGCCRKSSARLKKRRGHCTKECGCCLQTRGFELTKEEQEMYQPPINLICRQPTLYSARLFLAWTTGDVCPL